MSTETKATKMLSYLVQDKKINPLLALNKFGISPTGFHSYLSMLRKGKIDGIKWPIDGGKWVSVNNTGYNEYRLEKDWRNKILNQMNL